MANSIDDLKAILDAKDLDNPGTLSSDDLIAIRDYLNSMLARRSSNPLPSDDGSDFGQGSNAYNLCQSHVKSSYDGSHLSVNDLDTWQQTNLMNQTCNAHADNTTAWCSSRTTCNCNDRTACNCHGRDSDCLARTIDVLSATCLCNGRSDSYCSSRAADCGSRTACYCNNHDPGGGVGCGDNQGCNCHARYTACPCRSRSWCQSRTACFCNGRTVCYCHARTDYICTSRTTCDCNDRTACNCHGRDSDCLARTIDVLSTTCSCDTRCSCNTVDVFS